jgi:hypothetical protein
MPCAPIDLMRSCRSPRDATVLVRRNQRAKGCANLGKAFGPVFGGQRTLMRDNDFVIHICLLLEPRQRAL